MKDLKEDATDARIGLMEIKELGLSLCCFARQTKSFVK